MTTPLVGPDPDALHPIPAHPRVMFVKNLAGLPNVRIGAYTYYDDPGGPEAFRRNVLYHYEFSGDRLEIGRFCALATGTRFMMNGANHRLDGLTTYPFPIFGGDWIGRFPGELDFASRGNTVVGNDVWIGYDSLILPGVRIGDGAVVGAGSVVSRDVPPYAVVVGNPARVVRMRFPPDVVERLLALAWWDWDVERITRSIPLLSSGRPEDLDGLG